MEDIFMVRKENVTFVPRRDRPWEPLDKWYVGHHITVTLVEYGRYTEQHNYSAGNMVYFPDKDDYFSIRSVQKVATGGL